MATPKHPTGADQSKYPAEQAKRGMGQEDIEAERFREREVMDRTRRNESDGRDDRTGGR